MPLLARCLSRLLAAPLPTTRFSRARYMSPGGPAILALLDFSLSAFKIEREQNRAAFILLVFI